MNIIHFYFLIYYDIYKFRLLLIFVLFLETNYKSSTSSEEEIQDTDNFENENCAGPSKCKRARKI